MRAEFSENFLGGGGAKLSRPQNADQLRFIQLMIAAQQDKNRFALDEVDQCLDLAAGGDIVRRLGECFDGEDARRRELFNFGFRISDFGFRRSARRLLDVGRVAATFAVNDFVFTGLGRDHEFVREFAAHHAGIGLDRNRLESAPLKNARISIVHFPVADLRGLIGRIKAVGVLHDEFPGAHEAEARADFIAKLGLNLIEILRQLAVGTDFNGHQGGDDFFVGGTQEPFAFGVVLQPEQHLAGGLVAPAPLPDFGRLESGHQDFHRAGAVHLFADDLLHLAERAQSERKKSVKAASQLADETGAQQQLVRRDFRVGRRFFQRGNECLRPAHRDLRFAICDLRFAIYAPICVPKSLPDAQIVNRKS